MESLSLNLEDEDLTLATESANPAKCLLVYDFDQTITVEHVFHTTVGENDVGALATTYDDDQIIGWFGGAERVQELRQHFQTLKDTGVQLRILSFGFCGIINYCLNVAGLEGIFEEEHIFGQDSEELIEKQGQKHALIEEWMNNMNLERKNVVFVDDDARNISAVNNTMFCLTVYVKERNGMTDKQMKQLEKHMTQRALELQAAVLATET